MSRIVGVASARSCSETARPGVVFMRQPPLPPDPISPLFSEDAEPDGSPVHVPTMTFYGFRQILPPQGRSNQPQPVAPRSSPSAPATQTAAPRNTPQTSTPRSDCPRGERGSGTKSASIPASRSTTPDRGEIPESTPISATVPHSEPAPHKREVSKSQSPAGAAAAFSGAVTAPESGAILDRFPITLAWFSGALVGVIAHSLARGDSWKTGPLQEASGPHVIWLRPGVSHRVQMAAWLVAPTPLILEP